MGKGGGGGTQQPTQKPAQQPVQQPAQQTPSGGLDLASLLMLLGMFGQGGRQQPPPTQPELNEIEVTPWEELFTPYGDNWYEVPTKDTRRG